LLSFPKSQFVKLAYRVVFPFELRLFNTSDDAENPDRLYELFGIVIHVGVGYHHGHYVTIVKVGGRWVVFDDTNVGFIEEADIARYFGDSPGSGSAYVLFYQAVDLDYENLGLARPVPAYETATTAPFEPGSAPVNPLETSAPIRVASPAAMDISPSKVNTSLPLSSPPNGLSSSSSSLAGGGGLFGKRQGSTSGPGLTNEEKMDSEKLSSGEDGSEPSEAERDELPLLLLVVCLALQVLKLSRLKLHLARIDPAWQPTRRLEVL